MVVSCSTSCANMLEVQPLTHDDCRLILQHSDQFLSLVECDNSKASAELCAESNSQRHISSKGDTINWIKGFHPTEQINRKNMRVFFKHQLRPSEGAVKRQIIVCGLKTENVSLKGNNNAVARFSSLHAVFASRDNTERRTRSEMEGVWKRQPYPTLLEPSVA